MAPTNKENAKKNMSPEDDDGLDYRQRRDKNNQAVKKSRVKTKMRTQQTLERMNQLKNENQDLGNAIRKLSVELKLLKSFFLQQSNSPTLLSCFDGVDLNTFFYDVAHEIEDTELHDSEQ